MLFCVLLVLFLTLTYGHDGCDPSLVKVKNEMNRRINQGLSIYSDLDEQAKANWRIAKKIKNKVNSEDLNDCRVHKKVESLHRVIVDYQKLFKSDQSGQNLEKFDYDFETMKTRVVEANVRCMEIIKKLNC